MRYLLMFQALFALALYTSMASANSMQALSSDTLSITPRDGHSLFNDSIDQAHSSIEMMMYHISDTETAKHLLEARKRGVTIRLILDEKVLSNPAAQALSNQLSQGGIEVRASSPLFSLTHAKAAVFDKSWSLITSINLSRTDWYTRDFGVKTLDPEVIQEFESVFAADWDNAQNKTANTPNLNVEKLVWSPVNSKEKILALIKSATSSLYLEVENLGDPDVLAALENRAQNRVHVVVVVPACVEGGGSRNLPYMSALANAGVDAKLSVPPYTGQNPYIHAKSIVVDDKIFYVGSENFSNNSLSLARELGLIEESPSLSTTLRETIAEDANLATASKDLPSSFSCATKQAPQHPVN